MSSSIPFEIIKQDLLKDEEFRIEYEKLHPRYATVAQIIAPI